MSEEESIVESKADINTVDDEVISEHEVVVADIDDIVTQEDVIE